MGITIKEIARLAGVSRGTVDRVLNNRGQVSAKVKVKILNIAKDFNYKKNVLASRLATSSSVKISVVLPSSSEDSFWEGPLKGVTKMEESIADYGMSIELHFFNLFNSISYSEAFEKAISTRPNAILVAPVFLKETLSQMQMSKQNGIPIVCINSEIDTTDFLSFIGQDSFQSGILAGKLFDLQFNINSQIVVISQGHDSKNATHIKKKIDGLKQYNYDNNCGFEIIDIQIEDFQDKNVIQQKSDYILSSFKNIRGIFFTNSRAFNFINNSNLIDKIDKQTTIVGYDLIDENISLIQDKKIDFILHQKPEMQGYLGILSLFNHFIHRKKIDVRQYLPIDIVVKENISTYLDERDRFLDSVI